MLKLIVGGKEATPVHSFFIHKDPLTSRSRFFNKALKEYAEKDQHSEGAFMTLGRSRGHIIA
jgi:hypothetical protein